MAITDQLGAPDVERVVEGRNTLCRFVRCEASAAAPVTWSNIYGLQDWKVGKPEIQFTKEVFQQGGGYESTKKERGRIWPIELTFLKGEAFNQILDFFGVSLSTSGQAILPMYAEDNYPDITLEMVVRESNNQTHIGSVVIPDIVIEDLDFDMPLDDSLITITGYTKRFPFLLVSGAEMVYDVFTGDGSTTDFTLSNTPVDLATATSYRELDLDNIYYVKEKASTADTGIIKTSDYSVATTTLSASTAPASGTLVQVLYAKVTT